MAGRPQSRFQDRPVHHGLLAGHPNYKRAYSLSSCALDRGFYEVTVKRDGKMGTRIVDWAKAGDKLFVIPPVGKFLPVYEPNKHLVCIAGGSGVTPFRGFAREATRRKLATKITVLYSVRTPGHHLQHRIPRVGKGESEFQIPRHLHARLRRNTIGPAAAGESRRMGQGNRERICPTRFSTPAARMPWSNSPNTSWSTNWACRRSR
jgi:hypothetical protein